MNTNTKHFSAIFLFSLLISLTGCIQDTFFTDKDLIGHYVGSIEGKTTFSDRSTVTLGPLGTMDFVSQLNERGETKAFLQDNECLVPVTVYPSGVVLVDTELCTYIDDEGVSCNVNHRGNGNILGDGRIIFHLKRDFLCNHSPEPLEGESDFTFSGLSDRP